MTKRDILDKLLILKYELQGDAKRHYRDQDGFDYNFGYGQACEYYAELIDNLYTKVKEDVERQVKKENERYHNG